MVYTAAKLERENITCVTKATFNCEQFDLLCTSMKSLGGKRNNRHMVMKHRGTKKTKKTRDLSSNCKNVCKEEAYILKDCSFICYRSIWI